MTSEAALEILPDPEALARLRRVIGITAPT